MENKKDCLFCKIVRGEIPSKKIYENDKILAFYDIKPQARFHALLIPKSHVTSFLDIKKDSMDIMKDIYLAVDDIATQENLKKNGFRTVMNTGAEGGQTVFHLHVHLLADAKISPRFGNG